LRIKKSALCSGSHAEKVRDLLNDFGFQVSIGNSIIRDVAKSKDKITVYSVEVETSPKDKAEYLHPVDIFGTKLKTPLHVIYLFGNLSANDIIERVCGLELSSTALVIMDGFLDIGSRRQLAELFHGEKTGRNPFLFVDRMLLLHLALHERSQRIPILLSCTLPYTSSFQPFVMTGSVSDEMFIGRKDELRSILDANGPIIVYGGRQLGKTALLERARSLANHPKNLHYAVYLSVVGYREEARFVEELVSKLKEQGLKVKSSKTVKDLCIDLKVRYGKEWKNLTLLIDEADSLLDSLKQNEPPYAPITYLLNLRRETNNDMKFVFA
jgi:Cdc6-like AAA superfamily ATPase